MKFINTGPVSIRVWMGGAQGEVGGGKGYNNEVR